MEDELPVLLTRRLKLRDWRDADLEPFARMNADPRTLSFLPAALTREESDAMVGRFRQQRDQHGFSHWAVERLEDGAFLGGVGLLVPGFEAHFMPAVEIGWRLAPDYHNQGYATEAAAAVRDHAFGPLRLTEIVSFTVPENLPSRRVMEKIGMTRDPAEDFDHPKLPPGHPLLRHVLYRLKAVSPESTRGR